MRKTYAKPIHDTDTCKACGAQPLEGLNPWGVCILAVQCEKRRKGSKS